MAEIRLFNTLSKEKEVFKAIKSGRVTMYNCGPTVYDNAHVGNLRSYVFADTLRRTLEYGGYEVNQVINITDIGHLASDGDDGEDKMTKALKREKLDLTLENMHRIATTYFEKYVDDLKSLNIELPANFPRASDHIQEDLDLVKILEEKGYAYKISDGIYFDTTKFKDYGRLGNVAASLEKNKDVARIVSNPEKHNPADFVLWKLDPKIGWDSPWGRGFPGWHIECSAMSRKYLGQPFDIHTGGIDHIPVHHNNEIAQSEAAYDVPLANYWLHNAFLTLNNEKMAKSKGGNITLETLNEQSISPVGYRYWLLTAHYRAQVNLNYEAILAAQSAMIRLMSIISGYPDNGSIIPEYQEKFISAINDDLDTPRAIALIWNLIKDPAHTPENKRATILNFDLVLGLGLANVPRAQDETVPAEVVALAEAREQARTKKDWDQADALRLEIESRGYTLNDTPQGIDIRKK